jgi:acetylornithine deacetylase
MMGKLEAKIADAVATLKNDIVNFISKTVQMPSLPGSEKEVQAVISQKMESLGLDVDTFAVRPEELKVHPAFSDDGFPFDNRVNVIGKWKGATDPGKTTRSLILNGHVDVVSPGDESLWADPPWSGRVADGKIYGRGSTDMKAGIAAAIFAIEAIKKLGIKLAGDVLVESVVGEETGGCGTLAGILKGYRADAAIIIEPTALKICPVQSGALSFRLHVKGRAIHGCMKNKGVSAIANFYHLFRAIESFEQRRHRQYQNPLYPDPLNIAPISIGVLKSGEWHSTVPDRLVAEGRYGIFPDESVESAKEQFTKMIRLTAEQDDWLQSHPPVVEWFEGQFESGQTSLDDPVIGVLSDCHQYITGEKPKIEGVTYGSDLRLFTNHGNIPAVLYGPGDVVDAHTVDECIAVDEVIRATSVLALTLVAWCGR